MALNANQIPIYANKPKTGGVAITASSNTVTLGNNTNAATIYTAEATTGSRITSLLASTDDTVTVNVFLFIYRGTTVQPIGMVNVPLSSGNTNAARFPVDMLDPSNLPGLPIDQYGKRYIDLGPGDVLKCGALANLTAAKSCWITAIANDYA
jgi:hypothetical protein